MFVSLIGAPSNFLRRLFLFQSGFLYLYFRIKATFSVYWNSWGYSGINHFGFSELPYLLLYLLISWPRGIIWLPFFTSRSVWCKIGLILRRDNGDWVQSWPADWSHLSHDSITIFIYCLYYSHPWVVGSRIRGHLFPLIYGDLISL